MPLQEVSQLVYENDEDCLKYLVDVRFEYLRGMKVGLCWYRSAFLNTLMLVFQRGYLEL